MNSHAVEYLLVGGFSVGFYGYPRATGDIDIWIAINQQNADRITTALTEFGFGKSNLSPEMFLREHQVVRMGVPPLRIDVLTSISGVDFTECYSARIVADLDGVPVSIISLNHLKTNKAASGRHKDLNDLENLP